MKKHSRKYFLYIIPLIIFILVSSFFAKSDSNILGTSILTILRNIAEEHSLEPPDLGIKSVSIKKSSNPTKDFNYYKYKTTIILKNYGGDLEDARVILQGGKNQKHTLVKNTQTGFTLKRGENYIIRDYEIVFDGKYNGGEVTLEIDVKDKVDYYKDNNFYTVEIFEDSPKITSISLSDILEDGTYVLDFDLLPFSIRKHDYEILTSNSAVYDEGDIRYTEFYDSDDIYGYYRIKNSLENIESDFNSKNVSELDSHYATFPNDPFAGEKEYYVYVKATNTETGYYAISNILLFKAQEEMNRAEFAKLFVDQSGTDLYDDGMNFYDDIDMRQWYGPYIQTLYNLGLINTSSFKFYPEEIMTRGEALRIVLDFYDVDLVIPEGAPHFEDVPEENEIFTYAETLYASGGAYGFSKNFYPDAPAAKNYLKYLIYEYNKDN